MSHGSFDPVVLDLMLPRRDGLEILTTLRKRGVQTPVLILTAKDTVDDRVRGLDSGADDYIVKPFAFPREMLARDVSRITARATPPSTNVIDVTVVRLRRKVDDPFEATLLHTVRGVGFALRSERG